MVSYKEGIVKALDELKDRTGSSLPAIKKHMQASLPQDKKWANGMFLSILKSMVTSGDLVQTKGSYKLSAEFKKKRTDALKPKKPKKKTEATTTKKTVPKKAAPKKAAEGTAPKKVRTQNIILPSFFSLPSKLLK
jgi:histone H1/5